MPIRSDPKHLGRAWISPAEPVVAGAHGTWTLSYEVGAYGYDENARLKIGLRFASDFGAPQFDRPAEANYTTLRLETRNPTAVAKLTYETRGQPRPFFKCLAVAIAAGSLDPGDRIHITYGDRSGGGPGARAQTFREKGCEWRVFVDPFGTEVYTVLEDSPRLDIAGGALHRLVVLAPTTVRPGEPFDALVKGEDLWGNPCERHAGSARLEAAGALTGLPATVDFESGRLAVARLEGLRLAQPGTEARIAARAPDGRAATSNLIRALAPGETPAWWGDLHGQTRATVGTGTMAEYYEFARDVALLDAACHQGNDFQITPAEWRNLLDETARFHRDGRFVIFIGWEWSGMTSGGGDRNVLFRGDRAVLHRSSHAEVEDAADLETDCFPVSELYERLRGREDVILVPHVGGRYADIVRYFEPALESVVEVYSDWGRFEWMIADAFRKGLKVGFVANSDGHKGRPGASHPGAGTFGVYGGLTCLLAEARTREALFAALKARRCYGVSNGQRVFVDLSVNGLPMGAEGTARGEVLVKGRVAGTGALARIDLLRGLEIVRTRTPYRAADFENSNRYRVEWSGSKVRGRGRLTVWDGHLELSEGRILAAAPYAMVNPEKGVRLEGPRRVNWRSNTTGGDNGVDLTLEGAHGATIRFHTPVKDLDIPVSALKDDRAQVFPCGGLDLAVRARRLPASGFTDSLSIEERLPAPEAPWSAYWIRATQEDGTQAWTSPVYLAPET